LTEMMNWRLESAAHAEMWHFKREARAGQMSTKEWGRGFLKRAKQKPRLPLEPETNEPHRGAVGVEGRKVSFAEDSGLIYSFSRGQRIRRVVRGDQDRVDDIRGFSHGKKENGLASPKGTKVLVDKFAKLDKTKKKTNPTHLTP